MSLKLNVALAKTDHLASVYRTSFEAAVQFFKKSDGSFRGEKKTYEPAPGTIDQPGQRSFKGVVTTVDEKLAWLFENAEEYINASFDQEKTNASGKAKAELKVGDEVWGEFTTLELLRLKNILEQPVFEQLLVSIPTRSDAELWEPTEDAAFEGRGIFESPILAGEAKSTIKENYILTDPNITRETATNYKPQVSTKDTIITLGTYTHQRFSGEWTPRQQAEVMKRRTLLLSAVITALKTANDVEVEDSALTAQKVFGYLLGN
jgi:hypothetical protein